MLMISFILPVVENLSATTELDVGGTHYDAGEEWFGLCVSVTHNVPTGSADKTRSEDSEECFFDSCDVGLDAEWLPVTQAHRVFFNSAPVFSESASPGSPAPVFSLYKPPKH
jgi:hypothetical protein